MSKQLLIETHPVKITSSPLTESVGGVKKPLIVEGILATAEDIAARFPKTKKEPAPIADLKVPEPKVNPRIPTKADIEIPKL